MAQHSIERLYRQFSAPVTDVDCGQRCAPYNQGIPFCCDTRCLVPVIDQAEWDYLSTHTTLWHPWEPADPAWKTALQAEAAPEAILVECLGHTHCQREFRSLACREFPFFPYLDSRGEFLGLSVYWEYQEQCWVLSNLDQVTPEFRQQFISVFDDRFTQEPQERESFFQFSARMRQFFLKKRRTIPIFHKNGQTYKISPARETLKPVLPNGFPRFGPYQVTHFLRFPGE